MSETHAMENGVQAQPGEKQPVTDIEKGETPAMVDPEKAENNNGTLAPPTGEAASESDMSNNHVNAPPAKPAAMPSPPPDGGVQAWLQVLCGFSLFFNTWGLLNTFGIYQTYYEGGTLFSTSASNISWIGAIQAYCVLVTGLFAGPVYDMGYLRALLIAGSFMIVFGHMMLSLSTEFYQALLSQGFCVGIGAGLLFIPTVALLPTYFNKHLGAAIGLAASGSSMGGIIYPIVFYKLIDQVGFGWSTRVIGFIALATLIPPVFFMKMRIKPAKARSLIDMTVFTDVPFMVFVVSTLIGFMGLYVVLFYISYFSGAQGITDQSLSFYIVPILNAASVFGRTLPNILADVVGPLNIVSSGAFVCGILTFCLIAVHDVAGIIVVTIFFGFFSGVFIALPPMCLARLTQDKSKYGTRMGMSFAFIGFSVLAGGPGAGSILQTYSSGWTGVWVFGGVVFIVCGIIESLLRMHLAKWKLAAKL